MLRIACKALLISAACLSTGAKLHRSGLVGFVVTPQEINRCLAVVRAAAASRTVQSPAARKARGAGISDR